MFRRQHAGRRVAAALALAAASGLAARPVLACSICRCGDPTFNALGSNIYASGRWIVAIDWDRLEKEQGAFEAEGAEGNTRGAASRRAAQQEEIETITENRLTAAVSYSFADRFNLVARVPVSWRELTEEGETEHGSGLSDPEFYALVRLWSSNFAPGLGRRAWLSATAGVKTPWGQNDLTEDGVRLDEHVQPGTGSTDLFGGLSGLYLFDEKSAIFSSVSYRGTGTNEFGYKYGNVVLANVAYERKFGERLDTVLELNYRWAGEDIVNSAGVRDPNTGGSVLYITPRVIVGIVRGLVARASVQIPAWEDLNGVQDEKPVVNAGLTYVF
jgi:hypothetical protein